MIFFPRVVLSLCVKKKVLLTLLLRFKTNIKPFMQMFKKKKRLLTWRGSAGLLLVFTPGVNPTLKLFGSHPHAEGQRRMFVSSASSLTLVTCGQRCITAWGGEGGGHVHGMHAACVDICACPICYDWPRLAGISGAPNPPSLPLTHSPITERRSNEQLPPWSLRSEATSLADCQLRYRYSQARDERENSFHTLSKTGPENKEFTIFSALCV